jgi:hypothetical protein
MAAQYGKKGDAGCHPALGRDDGKVCHPARGSERLIVLQIQPTVAFLVPQIATILDYLEWCNGIDRETISCNWP